MESRLVQSKTCSCSYALSKAPILHRTCNRVPQASQHNIVKRSRDGLHGARRCGRRLHVVYNTAEPKPKQNISGYTPANFVSYSDAPEHRCHHLIAVEVEAPASICFSVWNDWNRIVDFMDLVSQIGLDPQQPDMALFQCFYRWGNLPVLEIVFLLSKTDIEQDKSIKFETVHGMPASGEVQFIEADGPNGPKTSVLFKLEHQMPNVLVDLAVNTFGVETSCREIFTENMQEFKTLVETLAKDPASAAPRMEAEPRRIQVGMPAHDAAEEEEEWEEGEEEEQDEAMALSAGEPHAADEEQLHDQAAAGVMEAERAGSGAAQQAGQQAGTGREKEAESVGSRDSARARAPREGSASAPPPAQLKARGKQARRSAASAMST